VDDIPAIFLYSPIYLYGVNTQVKGIEIKNVVLPSKRFSQIEDWHIETKRVWK
jgi:peptide/nickel transport system substrate-binding protein